MRGQLDIGQSHRKNKQVTYQVLNEHQWCDKSKDGEPLCCVERGVMTAGGVESQHFRQSQTLRRHSNEAEAENNVVFVIKCSIRA
jgi:hypothetical protein